MDELPPFSFTARLVPAIVTRHPGLGAHLPSPFRLSKSRCLNRFGPLSALAHRPLLTLREIIVTAATCGFPGSVRSSRQVKFREGTEPGQLGRLCVLGTGPTS